MSPVIKVLRPQIKFLPIIESSHRKKVSPGRQLNGKKSALPGQPPAGLIFTGKMSVGRDFSEGERSYNGEPAGKDCGRSGPAESAVLCHVAVDCTSMSSLRAVLRR